MSEAKDLAPQGLHYIDNFITQEEHDALVKYIDATEWNNPDMGRKTQHYGYAYVYATRGVSKKATPIPEIFGKLCDKLAKSFPRRPEQIIVNNYEPGQGIGVHIDHTKHFGPVVASISLLSPVEMEFTRNDEAYFQILQPRSIVLLKDDARYRWRHEIRARQYDAINGKRRMRERRISITFRTMTHLDKQAKN